MDYRGVKVGSLKVFAFCMEERSWLILSYEMCNKNVTVRFSCICLKENTFCNSCFVESIFMSSYFNLCKEITKNILEGFRFTAV